MRRRTFAASALASLIAAAAPLPSAAAAESAGPVPVEPRLEHADIVRANRMGDPPADRLVAKLLDEGKVADVNDLFRTIGKLSSTDQKDLEALPDDLKEFLVHAAPPPPGWTAQDVARAEQFYRHHHTVPNMLQGTVGLIGCYLAPTGAHTLSSTHRLDRPSRRLSQSSRLFMGMSDPGAMTDGTLAASVTKVRLVHASVRQLHKRSGHWDYTAHGEPVSLKFLTGASLVFSSQVLTAMRNLGIQVTPEDADGFATAWHYVDHYLGVPPEFLTPKDARVGERVWARERDTYKEWAPSPAGSRMTGYALQYYRELLPPGLSDAFISMVRTALGDTYADMVDIPRSPLDLPVTLATTGLGILTQHAQDFLGAPAKKLTGADPMAEFIGILTTRFENDVFRPAIVADQDTEPQLHQELTDNR
ncbi:oxygenase MpaB family protein [Streptomyces sp. NPDC087440]|uniref:oxygenase MpaB family protein n=1 Tax=Streptomyces sp. NPDC087440 TaxID=3365790 RepID=UPI0037F980E3